MRQLLPIVVLIVSTVLSFPPSALAETVKIQSGEHADFSRLVLYFEESGEWQFGKIQGGYEFRSSAKSIHFDPSKVFERIPRTRIEAITDRGDGRLFVAVSCDCHADAFEIRGGELVLDIKDGRPPAYAARFNNELPELEVTSASDSDVPVSISARPKPRPITNGSDSPTVTSKSSSNETASGITQQITSASAPAVSSQMSDLVGNETEAARRGLPLFLPALSAGPNQRQGRAVPQVSTGHGSDGGAEIQAPSHVAESFEATHDLSDFEQVLLAQIGRATAQGLLTPDLSPTEAQIANMMFPEPEPDDVSLQPRTSGEAVADISTEGHSSQQRVAPSPVPLPEAHLHIETSVDRDNPGSSVDRALTDNGAICPQDSRFDIKTWGNPRSTPDTAFDGLPFVALANGSNHGGDGILPPSHGTQTSGESSAGPGEAALILPVDLSQGADLGAFRSGILGEFDRPDGAAITRLARYYIYLGFGAETTALLRRYEDVVQHPDDLIVMAQIMDGVPVKNGFPIQFTACDNKVALWASLSQTRFNRGQEINRKSIIAAFSELPLHLRRHLGPRLAGQFMEIDDEETAIALRNAILRAPGPHGTETELLTARLEEPEKAIAQLQAIVKDENTETAPALLQLLARQREGSLPTNAKTIALVASLAFENRGSPMGFQLIESEIRALAANGEFEAAFGRLQYYRNRKDLPSDLAIHLREGLLVSLSREGRDADFVRYTVPSGPGAFPDSLSRSVAAERFAALGFADIARDYFSYDMAAPTEMARRLLARVALDERKPLVALSYLTGLSDAQANHLRARAVSMSDDHEAAARIYEDLGDDTSQIDEAWLAGDWNQVARLDDGIRGKASALMLEPIPGSDPGQGALAHGKALLVGSAHSRTVLQRLLSAADG